MKPKAPLLLLYVTVVLIGWIAVIAFVQRTRVVEGTWVDLFEQSSFFEGKTIAEACNAQFDDAPWFEYDPPENTGLGTLVSANRGKRGKGQYISDIGEWPVSAYSVVFVGRRKVSEMLGLAPLLGFGYGHLGSAGSKFEVDRVLSIRQIANAKCDVRSSVVGT